jgi:thiamine-phosphate pyrophosphorylase
MDARLIAWARRVKRGALPTLWLFTDPARMPDLPVLIRGLPPGLCGVVFRHDGAPGRAALAAAIAKLCRGRRIALVLAGDITLASRLRAGIHLRGGRWPGRARLPAGWIVTASVHSAAELSQSRRAGARILFISPVFPTRSHPGAAGLGPHRFRALARLAAPAKAYALGGVDGHSVRQLGKFCAGAGAIDAFLGSK